jgi:hypothetical protein
MALDERYIVASDIEQYYVDKDSGLPLANGTLEFFRDIARSTPKPVFQLSGAPPNYTYTSMGAVITLSAVGTVQNSGGDNEVIYYYPFDDDGNLDLYYIVVRDSNGVEQFSREAWPNITASDDPTSDLFPIQNQIANPQFTKVFINEDFTTTYTVTAATNEVFAFAPDWDFVISGTGTVVVERIPISGNDNIVTSPPYVLDITISGGVTSCQLRQRFNVNSGLWASTNNEPIFISGTMIARNQAAGTTGLQMFYVESSGGSPIAIIDESFTNAGYSVLTGVTDEPIPSSTNTDVGLDGFIDIYISFQTGSHVRISSIQVVPTANQAGADFLQYDLNSSNREQALMGDYYIPNLNKRPVPSLITAWDFTLNPFQFAASGSIATTAAYICDQTIALRGATGNVAYARNSITRGLQFTTSGTNDSFYIMQYLTGDQAKKIIGTMLSVNVNAFKDTDTDDVTMRVYLIRATAAAVVPTLPTSIGTVDTSGVFTVSATGWAEIPRSGLDTAKAILPELSDNDDLNNEEMDMGFTGWQITDPAQIGDTDKFAIVVTFAYIDATTVITANSVSVIPNAIPCRAAPQTVDQVLEECQFYYEKSYATTIFAGASTTSNSVFAEQFADQAGGATVNGYIKGFGHRYNTIKRAAPTTLTFYNPITGASASILFTLTDGANQLATANLAISDWIQIDSSTKGFSYHSGTAGAQSTAGNASTHPEGYILYHFIADSRLGV